MKPLLPIKTGTTIPEIIPAHGDFEQWFAAALGGTVGPNPGGREMDIRVAYAEPAAAQAA